MIFILVIFIAILGSWIFLPGSRIPSLLNRALKGVVFRTVDLLEVVVPKMYRWTVAVCRWIGRKIVVLYRWITDKLTRFGRWCYNMVSRFCRWCFNMATRFLRWVIGIISRIARWCINWVKTFPTRHRILYAHIQCAIFCTLPLCITVYFETYIIIALKLVTDKDTAYSYAWKLSIAVDQMATLLGFGQTRILRLLVNRRGVDILQISIISYEALGIALGALANWPHATHHRNDVHFSAPIWCVAFLALFPAIGLYIVLVKYIVKEDDDPEPLRSRPIRYYFPLARDQFSLALVLVTIGCAVSSFVNHSALHFYENVAHSSVVCYNNMATQVTVLIVGRLAGVYLARSPTTVTEYALSVVVRAIGATPAALFGNSDIMSLYGWWHAFILNIVFFFGWKLILLIFIFLSVLYSHCNKRYFNK